MDKALRNTLRNVVIKCRELLQEAVAELLQGQFGIHADGKVEDVARLAHLSEEDLRYREEVLAHLEHIKASGVKPKDATAQLIREAAFTHLNRLCAYKMMTSRGLIEDPVGKGLKSRGFVFYLADHPADEALYTGAQQDLAYRHYFEWLNESLSSEIGVLFAREDLSTRLFSPYRVLVKVLDLINSEELAGIWAEDETIGWVYQYFTPKELREKSRKEHPAPQNSYELAFRNQFYTPRYVVEFLVDNTLGRLWHEMQKGETELKERCRYLVRRPIEVFLPPGEEEANDKAGAPTDLSHDNLLKQPVYVRHREKKDPREIKILDPACGSGHFLLYCFGLLEVIYEEAYRDKNLGPSLQTDYPTIEELKREIPRLILQHNLHGIDIDLRSTQISALALWLRCQRTYRELGIEKAARPQIKKTNIVCAEPMPGESELLEEFLKEVYPPFLADVVRVVFDKMKLAGEAGSLLKIEEEISSAIAEAKKHWRAVPPQQQLALFREEKLSDGKQGALFDLSGITDEEFWNEAEARVLESLAEYSQHIASNGQGFRRRLFADDAAQGFAFVDICRKRFDVVLMNPPFGLPTSKCAVGNDQSYVEAISKNLAWGFVMRAKSLLGHRSYCGAIVDRTIFQKSSYEQFRLDLIQSQHTRCYADLGVGILDDADVMTSAFAVENTQTDTESTFIDLRQEVQLRKPLILQTATMQFCSGRLAPNVYYRKASELLAVPFASMAYWVSNTTIERIFKQKTIGDLGFRIGGGLQCNDVFRFVRLNPEIALIDRQYWVPFFNGGPYSEFWIQNLQRVLWKNDGADIKNKIINELGDHPSRFVKCEDMYMLPGIAGGKRGEYFDVQIMPAGMIFSNEGRAFQAERDSLIHFLLAYLNTHFCQNLVNVFCGQHKGSDYLRRVPVPELLLQDSSRLAALAVEVALIKRKWCTIDELDCDFISPYSVIPAVDSFGRAAELISSAVNGDDTKISAVVGEIRTITTRRLGEDLVKEIEDVGWTEAARNSDSVSNLSEAIEFACNPRGLTTNVVQFSLGMAFGRWDARFATGERPAPALPDPFAPLPLCAPATLADHHGLPLSRAPEGYPSRIDPNGLLLDDPAHPDDIVLRVRAVFELMWPNTAEALEREGCELLGVKELRDYFSKPTAGGFWMDHIKRYSKSRRKAPIYWLLRSSKGNYSIWLYYHRLDKDTLYKALLNYVEPKLRLEENNLSQLRQRRETVGTTGREAKQLEKELDKQESFISELHDFHDKLKRAADLHLEPDLNDGVVLNIAPLWELVPWTEAKKYWKELMEGKYEWSSISKQLQERGML